MEGSTLEVSAGKKATNIRLDKDESKKVENPKTSFSLQLMIFIGHFKNIINNAGGTFQNGKK